MKKSTGSPDIYQTITDKIIEKLKAGVCPWKRAWKAGEDAPQNWDGRLYRGMNWLLLSGNDYASNVYLTYRKAAELGGNVKKGEKGHFVTFWKFFRAGEVDPDTGKQKKFPMLRHFIVFNSEQCENLPERKESEKRAFVPIEECERMVAEMPQKPAIFENGRGDCFYRPSTDSVHMTQREYFKSDEAFYGTLFHELAHATGHSSRLDRLDDLGKAAFGSDNYGREELVAEMAAAFVCSAAHIDTPLIDNSAAYLASWIRTLQEDTKAVVWAAGKAARAADWILGTRFDEEKEEE